MTGRTRTSRTGLDLIKSFEGFRDSAVRLPDGRWIIGYGHVRTAREGLTINEKDAEDLLTHDLRPAEDVVSTLVYAPLAPNQYDALVSFAHNISPGQFRDSEVLRMLNGGDFIAAANGFDAWRRARINGRVMVVDALVRRRTAEKAMFLEHPSGRPAAPTPLVIPEFDPNALDPAPRKAEPQLRAPEPANEDEDGEPESDIALAVQKLAERVHEETPPSLKPTPPLPTFEPRPEVKADSTPELRSGHRPAPTAGSIDDARRAVAERLAKILERTEAMADRQEKAAEAVAPKAEPKPEPALEVKPEPVKVIAEKVVQPKQERLVIDGLPDFDVPAPKIEQPRARKVIDDTETFDPGRAPDEIFAAAVREQDRVNGASRSLLTGSASRFLPWIAVLILSVLGLGVGLSETMRAPDPNNAVTTMQGASVVFAVFGLLLVMSLYFIVTRSRDKG